MLSPFGLDRALRLGAEAAALYLLSTVVFDAVHFVLHRFERSRWQVLQRLATLHGAHHHFFDSTLQIQEGWASRNLLHHVLPEFLTRLAVVLSGTAVVEPLAVGIVLVIQLVQLGAVVLARGQDSNHRPLTRISARAMGWFVGAHYHALHHLHPAAYFSSVLSILDRVCGTALSLEGKTVVLTGASGALGSALQPLLEAKGARVLALKSGRDFGPFDARGSDAQLRVADILVLAHGSKLEQAMEANCHSFVALIERFRALTSARAQPVEVWAVGSEIEAHPSWGNEELAVYSRSKRAFARHAWRYFRDRSFVYRHIVPSGFRSQMGWGLLSARTTARIALALIMRGFRYVPVTYTGFALLNYFKFLLGGRTGPVH
jgi:monoglucosyldiacylglycerol epimerase